VVIGSIAFDKMVDEDDVRTMMGISPERAAEFMAAHGCDVAALNCGTGIDMAIAARIVARYRAAYDAMVLHATGADIEKKDTVYPNVHDGVEGMYFIQQCVASSGEDGAWKPLKHKRALAGDRKGQHSVRINDQYRICFVWKDGDAHQVEVVDYH